MEQTRQISSMERYIEKLEKDVDSLKHRNLSEASSQTNGNPYDSLQDSFKVVKEHPCNELEKNILENEITSEPVPDSMANFLLNSETDNILQMKSDNELDTLENNSNSVSKSCHLMGLNGNKTNNETDSRKVCSCGTMQCQDMRDSLEKEKQDLQVKINSIESCLDHERKNNKQQIEKIEKEMKDAINNLKIKYENIQTKAHRKSREIFNEQLILFEEKALLHKKLKEIEEDNEMIRKDNIELKKQLACMEASLEKATTEISRMRQKYKDAHASFTNVKERYEQCIQEERNRTHELAVKLSSDLFRELLTEESGKMTVEKEIQIHHNELPEGKNSNCDLLPEFSDFGSENVTFNNKIGIQENSLQEAVKSNPDLVGECSSEDTCNGTAVKGEKTGINTSELNISYPLKRISTTTSLNSDDLIDSDNKSNASDRNTEHVDRSATVNRANYVFISSDVSLEDINDELDNTEKMLYSRSEDEDSGIGTERNNYMDFDYKSELACIEMKYRKIMETCSEIDNMELTDNNPGVNLSEKKEALLDTNRKNESVPVSIEAHLELQNLENKPQYGKTEETYTKRDRFSEVSRHDLTERAVRTENEFIRVNQNDFDSTPLSSVSDVKIQDPENSSKPWKTDKETQTVTTISESNPPLTQQRNEEQRNELIFDDKVKEIIQQVNNQYDALMKGRLANMPYCSKDGDKSYNEIDTDGISRYKVKSSPLTACLRELKEDELEDEKLLGNEALKNSKQDDPNSF